LRETASLASSAGGLSQLDLPFQLFFSLKTKPNFARNRQPRKLGRRPWPTRSGHSALFTNDKAQFCAKPPASQARQAAVANPISRFRHVCFVPQRPSILRQTASLASWAGGLSQLDRAFQLFFFVLKKHKFERNRQPRKLGRRPWPTQSPVSAMSVLYLRDPQFCAKPPASQARQAALANSIGRFSCFFS
jgi:hypothetical protein